LFPILCPLKHFVEHMHGDQGKKDELHQAGKKDREPASGKKSHHREENPHARATL
jgi:hypothetical protein